MIQHRSVTMIDKELRGFIAQLNDIPRSDDRIDDLLSKIDELKLDRMKAVRTKTYDRMLTSLG
jgi:hypothetical protein